MSAEENPKDESDATNKLQETESKLKERKSRKEKVKPLAKVVIRRLPPTMTEDEFTKQIEPIPDHDYFYFVPADWSLGVNATCRAYINFCNQNDIFIFRDKFDGYVFVDNKGSEYPAVVEFAPFQGLPKGKSRKKDHKANTIETEPHFSQFLDTLKDEVSDGKNELKMEYSFQIKDDQKITSTPLLEYLANVRQERRDERKRKIEDKKKQREEEKQRKKNQLAKSMPKTIDEDAKENDDGIIVRTIKSRPLDRDRNKNDRNADGNKTEKSENSRSERERARNKERQARRKEERERNRKEREKEKEEKKNDKSEKGDRGDRSEKGEKGEKGDRGDRSEKTDKNDADTKHPKNDKDGNEKVKKYSESRRDRKKRAETSQSAKPSQSKTDQKETNESASSSAAAAVAQQDGHADAQRSRSFDEKDMSSAELKAMKDRSVTNLRNKDRPSLQIYQPGKRRTTNSATSEHDDPSENKGSVSPDIERECTEIVEPEKPSSSSTSAAKGNRKRNDAKESSKSQNDDRKKPSNEKRISRYSEKRNKAKEKRDVTDNPVAAGDFNSISNVNSNDNEKMDELS